ncbi:hypothetical protein GRADUATION_45 [Mycobacterium phage Graduation]|uniref:Uncharacterized protein n=2 Tax=Fromanvirus TaxID=186764 RepID=B3VG15_9CAUD|nr:hypothetical protein KBG_44 [Mycobacterium phage KBG]YP_008858583.1 hypothetical protein GRADUATION_45 [Mycobacterium phage Graduation]YP_009013687.1 hypothetical protein CL83_gp43 [Mycobacterium phage Doom]AOQ27783.1 hypothetical protein SEA_PACERPAUL_43 [Mycobacterium phage PacerPaul]ASZ74016.1 hypothetical protein SEA_SMAIRT_44 [Mycobacterium phage Smairt]AZF98210.1 hypothetical protein SEA_BONES_42 [Mycobacterium phage Bones]AZF98360.1 hypothetical protein SEA_BIGPAOLINI_42 [Mycobacter
MSKHDWLTFSDLNGEQYFKCVAQSEVARKWSPYLSLDGPGYEGRHRLPYGLSNIPYGTVIWSWSADAWIRRIKPEGKYPRNFTVVATAEEAAGLRRLK